MSTYQYSLEKYTGPATRYRCPACGVNKRFSRYVHNYTNQPVHPTVGRCSREVKCGYHLTPKQYFAQNGIAQTSPVHFKAAVTAKRVQAITPSPYSLQMVDDTLTGYEHNHLITFLKGLFGVELTAGLVSNYYLGTSTHWPGATVLWQVDKQLQPRAGKIMLYNAATGRRVKQPFNHITWVHTALKLPPCTLCQCFFGEHLLRKHTKPIAIVESEKTALIASLYLPQFTWLASGSLSNLTAEKCAVLKGLNVTLFPDLNGFDKWSEVAAQLTHIAPFVVSDLLQRKAPATHQAKGYDLADYLITFDYRVFTGQPAPAPPPPLPINWTEEINALETHFNSLTLPDGPVKLNTYSTIGNLRRYIDNHLIAVKRYNGNRVFLPYLERLRELKFYLHAALVT